MESLEELRGEVENLGREIEALRPTYGLADDFARPHLEVSADGEMHWVVCERGLEQERRSTRDPDELLY